MTSSLTRNSRFGRVIAWLGSIVGLSSCACGGSDEPTFADVLAGDLALDDGDKKAIQQALDEAGKKPEDLVVVVDGELPNFGNYALATKDGRVVHLKIERAALKTVSWASDLDRLKTLDLDMNKVESLKPLKGLTELEKVSFTENQLTSLTGLEKAKRLVSVAVVGNQIKSLKPLKNADDLYELSASNNKIKSLKPLSGKKKLEAVWINSNALESLDGLSNLPSLGRLYATHNKIDDVASLKDLPSLWMLHLDNNEISDISPLLALPKLEKVHLANNQIADEPEGVHKKWKTVDLEGNPFLVKKREEIRKNAPKVELYDTVPSGRGKMGASKQSCELIGNKCTGTIGRLEGAGRIKISSSNNRASVSFSTKKGKVRMYLRDNRADKKFRRGEATPGNEGSVSGHLLQVGTSTKYIAVESVDGRAEEISWTLSFY